jgi:hypothetical protein
MEILQRLVWLLGPPLLACLPLIALIIRQLWKDRDLRRKYRNSNLSKEEDLLIMEAEIDALINGDVDK